MKITFANYNIPASAITSSSRNTRNPIVIRNQQIKEVIILMVMKSDGLIILPLNQMSHRLPITLIRMIRNRDRSIFVA